MEATYEPAPKIARITTISIPAGATRRTNQDHQPVTPAQTQHRTRLATPPSLPFPPFPNEDNPSPPPSPSPQTTIDPPARPLWSDPDTPDTSTMAIDGPQRPRPSNTMDPADKAASKEDNPMLGDSLAALRAIVTNNRDHAILTIPSRNTPANHLDKYTNGQMPKIQDAHPTAIFDNLDLRVFDEWDILPGGKLAAIPFDDKPADIIQYETIQRRIFKAAAEITQGNQVAVAGSGPNVNTNARNPNCPPTFLIYNLSELQRRTLLERPIWSSTEVTFRVIPPQPTRPDLLFSIAGLSTLAMDDVQEMVYKVWHNAETLTEIYAAAQEADEDGHATSQEAIMNFISSLEVKRLDMKEKKGTPAPRFNIYADPKYIQNLKTWGNLRNFLASQPYSSLTLGRGTTKLAPFTCGICQGADHPRGLCPLPNIAGWNGPQWRTESKNNRADRSRDPLMRRLN